MTLEEARELLGLGLKATRKEIRAAYRRAARHWHPDRAPQGETRAFQERMQQINRAYQRIITFIEDYHYELVDTGVSQEYQRWWTSRFYTGVWGAPPPRAADADREED